MAKAAETASLPVRMGVAKPFGASSVTNEYQSTRIHSSARTVADRSRNRSLDRQFHVRAALLSPGTSHSAVPVPIPPPLMGIRLMPQHHGGGNQSLPGEDQDDFGMDLSDSDVPASEVGNDSFDVSQSRPGHTYGLRTDAYLADHDERSIIDSDSSAEDDPFADIDGGTGRHGNHRNRHDGEDGMEGMYPYAWALDGRRIGENAPIIRPSSPTSSFVS